VTWLATNPAARHRPAGNAEHGGLSPGRVIQAFQVVDQTVVRCKLEQWERLAVGLLQREPSWPNVRVSTEEQMTRGLDSIHQRAD